MNKLLQFKQMHEQKELLLLANAWDLLSALILEQSGCKAIGTTSWGVANAMGYKDGENIDFDDLLTLVSKIIAAIEIPLTVDIESGYSEHIEEVAENVIKLADLGVVGINIEDSLKNSTSLNDNGLNDKDQQSRLIGKIREKLDRNNYQEFFINARVDTYLVQKEPLKETIERSTRYITSGANGIFVPGVYRDEEIRQLVEAIEAPLNVLSLPNLTKAKDLNDLGVKRFSIGNALSDATIGFIETETKTLIEQKSTASLYKNCDIGTIFR